MIVLKAPQEQLLAALQAQNPSVQVDYTLAVDPTGLPSTQLNLLKDAKAQGATMADLKAAGVTPGTSCNGHSGWLVNPPPEVP